MINKLAGPLGAAILLAALFLLVTSTLYTEPVIVDKNAAPGLAAAETLDPSSTFLGLSSCALVGCVGAGFVAIITLKKEVS